MEAVPPPLSFCPFSWSPHRCALRHGAWLSRRPGTLLSRPSREGRGGAWVRGGEGEERGIGRDEWRKDSRREGPSAGTAGWRTAFPLSPA